MPATRVDFRSIKTKVTLVATGTFAVLLALLAALQAYQVERDMSEVLGKAQFALVSGIAGEVDVKLRTAQQALILASGAIPSTAVGNHRELMRILEGQPTLQLTFDSLLVLGRNGSVLLGLPAVGIRGPSAADREYFQRTIKERTPVISEPFAGTVIGQPVVVLTEPILDARGEVALVLAGTLHLLRPNLLGEVNNRRVGKTGTFALLGRNRTIILSGDSSRVMTQGPPPGVSPYFDNATSGQEGWELGLSGRGVKALFSYAQLATVPWVLTSTLPVAEAYAPIAAAQKRIVAVTGALILVLAPLIWLGTLYLTRPLLLLHDAIRRIRNDPGAIPDVPVRSRDEIGELAGDFAALIGERAEAAAALRKSEQQLSLALESSRLALFDWNVATGEVFLSEQWAVILGGKPAPTRSSFAALEERVHPEDRVALGRLIHDALTGASPHYRAEHRVRTNDGGWVWIQSNGEVTARDANGRALRFVGTNADVSERKRSEEELMESRAELERAARHDSLTGLPNRRLLTDRLDQALARARRSGQWMALLCLDLDHFKAINDTLGHVAGDALLVAFAERLNGCVRESDTVARLGGDEFVILLQDMRHPGDAEVIARKIIEAMRREFQVESRRLRSTTSIGVASTRGESSAQDLLKRADAALYQAKGAGRNRFRLASATGAQPGIALPKRAG